MSDILLLCSVTDHGTANVELVMEEALQDIPPLLHDIQERLRCELKETTNVVQYYHSTLIITDY